MNSNIAQSQEGLDLTLVYKLSELRKAETDGRYSALLSSEGEGKVIRQEEMMEREKKERTGKRRKKKHVCSRTCFSPVSQIPAILKNPRCIMGMRSLLW